MVRLLPRLLLLGLLGAGAPSYLWADQAGTLHEDKVLLKVPEPYRGAYRARAVATAGSGDEAGVPPSAPLAPAAARQYHARLALRTAVAQQRRLLLQLTEQLRAQVQRSAEARPNPILRLLPGQQQEAAADANEQQALIRAVLEVRRTLLVVLPEQARRENLPPAWLE